MNYFAYQEQRQAKSRPKFTHQDTVDLPEVMVTEEPMTEESARRFLDAEARAGLEGAFFGPR